MFLHELDVKVQESSLLTSIQYPQKAGRHLFVTNVAFENI